MPQEITEYYITYALDIPDLMQQVRAFIDGGWQPLGGVFVYPYFNMAHSKDESVFGQTLVKYAPIPL